MSTVAHHDGQETAILYEVIESGIYDPEEHGHEQIEGDRWLAQDDDGLSVADSQGVVNVLDWDYTEEQEPDFSGPFEPIYDGSKKFLLAKDQSMATIPLGSWICRQCGATTRTKEVDGKIQKPGQCNTCEKNGPFYHEGLEDQTLEGIQIVQRAQEMWHIPSGISDERYADLWDDVRQYIHTHWDAGDGENADAIYAGLTAFALSTWVRENLTFVPHLMLMGKTTGGKTRLLNTLARVSYRAIVSASATPASMFRLIDKYDVTYFVSEYHELDHDVKREVNNVVRAGQKRDEKVTRAEPTETGHEPAVFDPFSHMGVAAQYKPPDDIVNRCIQIQSSAPTRDMPATHNEHTAEKIRNRLLYARFKLLDSAKWDQAERQAYEHLARLNIDGRTREKLLSLLTVSYLWDAVDEIEPFIDLVVEQDRKAAADSEDAKFIETVRDLAFSESGGGSLVDIEISYDDVTDRFEQVTGMEKSNSWVGQLCKRLDIATKRKANGTVISDTELEAKLKSHCQELNLPFEHINGDEQVTKSEEQDEPLEPQIVHYVRQNQDGRDGVPRSEIVEHFEGKGHDKDRIEHKIDKALQRVRGGILKPNHGKEVYRTK